MDRAEDKGCHEGWAPMGPARLAVMRAWMSEAEITGTAVDAVMVWVGSVAGRRDGVAGCVAGPAGTAMLFGLGGLSHLAAHR